MMNANNTSPVVLMIDHDSIMHLSARQYLTEAGFELISVFNGIGIDTIKNHAPAIVLLSLTLPVIDDFARLAQVKELLVDEQIPLIIITDTEQAEHIQHCYELGATDVAIKPINWQILVHRLRYLLKTHQALSRLAISELRLSNAQRLAKLGNWEWSISDGQLYWSHEIYDIYQYHEHDISGNRPFLLVAVYELDLPRVEEAFNRALKFRETVNIDYRIKRSDSALVWVNQQIQPVIDKQGRLTGLTGTIQNITERKTNEKNLQLAAKIIETSNEAIVVTDNRKIIVSVNPAFTHITGFLPEEVIGKRPTIFQSGKHSYSFYKKMWASLAKTERWYGEIWNKCKNGEVHPSWMSINTIRIDGNISNYVAVYNDISERKQADDYIYRLAHYDTLTGLPNRLMFYDRLQLALTNASRHQLVLALMFIDLDQFKHINDTLGHSVGDELLVSVARRIQQTLGKTDTVARLGGDEFVVILTDTTVVTATQKAEKLIDILASVHHLSHHHVVSTPSIGIAFFPNDGEDAETLTKNADAAMYWAKESGRNGFKRYNKELTQLSQQRMLLEAELRTALEQRQFKLLYQPKFAVTSKMITGVEALLRWQHPEHGLVSPEYFLNLAEETGLIIAIGTWVIKSACTQAKQWHDLGFDIKVAVNISAKQLHAPGFVESIQQALDDSKLSAYALELEFPESLFINNDFDSLLRILTDLKKIGIAIAVDDFGTSYSCLSYLKQLPLDMLKIDKSFIRGLATDSEDQAIIQAILTLAQALNLKTIAEGVETSEQEMFLLDKQCSDMQGYWLSKPISAERLQMLIEVKKGV